MKIHVNEVPEDGLRERAVYDPVELDMAREDVHPRRPLEADVLATVSAREMVVQAAIRCPLTCTCARCLTEFEAMVSPRGVFTYKVAPGTVVDITDDVRQEVILAYPMTPLCRPACKGLCGVCGADRNTTTCGHEAPRGA